MLVYILLVSAKQTSQVFHGGCLWKGRKDVEAELFFLGWSWVSQDEGALENLPVTLGVHFSSTHDVSREGCDEAKRKVGVKKG